MHLGVSAVGEILAQLPPTGILPVTVMDLQIHPLKEMK